ncbi:hypothetical protein [Lysinibacillus sp. RC79]|uniref:hypothetical protein n=1 Tax=Lysinibacillus sp. RC79 TaxID=3156296 RepID=UPI0035146AE8
MKLTIKKTLKNKYMKEHVMFTEAEWSLKRGNIDYYVAEDAGKISLEPCSKTWEDVLCISVSLHHEEERSYWLIDASVINPWIGELIELPSTLCHTAQDVGHKVHNYFQNLPENVEEGWAVR